MKRLGLADIRRYFSAWVVMSPVSAAAVADRQLGYGNSPTMLIWVLSLFLWAAPVLAAEVIQHRLEVSIDPAKHRFSAKDELSLPAPRSGPIRFRLHPGLQPRVSEPGAGLRLLGGGSQAERAEEYELIFPEGRHEVRIEYGGEIHQAIAPLGRDYGREMGITSGVPTAPVAGSKG